MLGRYGLGVVGLIAGAIIVWAIFGFKNPFGSMAGKDCTMPDGITKGKTQADGSCKV